MARCTSSPPPPKANISGQKQIETMADQSRVTVVIQKEGNPPPRLATDVSATSDMIQKFSEAQKAEWDRLVDDQVKQRLAGHEGFKASMGKPAPASCSEEHFEEMYDKPDGYLTIVTDLVPYDRKDASFKWSAVKFASSTASVASIKETEAVLRVISESVRQTAKSKVRLIYDAAVAASGLVFPNTDKVQTLRELHQFWKSRNVTLEELRKIIDILIFTFDNRKVINEVVYHCYITNSLWKKNSKRLKGAKPGAEFVTGLVKTVITEGRKRFTRPSDSEHGLSISLSVPKTRKYASLGRRKDDTGDDVFKRYIRGWSSEKHKQFVEVKLKEKIEKCPILDAMSPIKPPKRESKRSATVRTLDWIAHHVGTAVTNFCSKAVAGGPAKKVRKVHSRVLCARSIVQLSYLVLPFVREAKNCELSTRVQAYHACSKGI